MKEENVKTIAPHPDYQANYLYYNRLNGKVIFDDTVRIATDFWHEKITNVRYAINDFGPTATVFLLNFHQTNKTFREELCAIFNHLGYTGLLVRKEEPPPKRRMDYYDN